MRGLAGNEPFPGTPGADALARDGGIIQIRPAVPADAAGLHAIYDRASVESIYRRFFVGGRQSVDDEVRRMVRELGEEHLTLVAEERGRLVAAGSYERLAAAPEQAEFALFVDEAEHGRGIGTLLLEHLAAAARRHGVKELLGDVLAGNEPMLKVAADLTPGLRTSAEVDVVQIRLATTDIDASAVDARDRQAKLTSLTPLLAPRSVVVIGAGRSPESAGHTILTRIRDGGFTGALYAVNPRARRPIAGVPTFASARRLPAPVDLAIVSVPSPAVAPVLADCAAAGVRTAAVLSAGFGEQGPAGRSAQANLVRIARHHGIRLLGPNCLGLANTDPQVRLNATLAETPPPGGLAVASQSGAVGLAILNHAARTGIGLSSFVSLGNTADVTATDLLAYWHDDPLTRAAALYLESIGDPRRFARVAGELARHKPVLVVKSGRSDAGRRAGSSHTAAAAAPDLVVDALLAQAGVVRCDNLGALLDTSRLLVHQPTLAGRRIGVLGNAGGINVLAVDAAEAVGLTVPALPATVRATVIRAPTGAATGANPFDLGADASAAAFRDAIGAVAASGLVDAVLVALAASTIAGDPAGILDAIARASDAAPVPVVVVLLGLPDPPGALGRRRAPVYALPEQAVTALAHAAGYGEWRHAPRGVQPQLAGIDRDAARRIVAEALTAGGGWQPARLARGLLRCYGLPGPRSRRSATGQGMIAFAAGIRHDPLFGSSITLCPGGEQAGPAADRVVRLPPLTALDAAGMWQSLPEAHRLVGHHSGPATDPAAVEELLLRLGRLAEDLPEVAVLVLDPVVATPSGLRVGRARLRLAGTADEPDPILRDLHEPD